MGDRSGRLGGIAARALWTAPLVLLGWSAPASAQPGAPPKTPAPAPKGPPPPPWAAKPPPAAPAPKPPEPAQQPPPAAPTPLPAAALDPFGDAPSAPPAAATAPAPAAAAPARSEPSAVAASAASPAGADRAADDEPARPSRRLTLTAGGVLAHTSDDVDPTATERGGPHLGVGFRPIERLEVALGYQASFGDWRSRLTAPPAGGDGTAEAFESRHRIDLGTRYDVLGGLEGFHLEPYLGVAWLSLSSELARSNLLGGAGGLGVGFDVTELARLEGSFGILGGVDLSESPMVVAGGVRSAWTWSGGVAVGATDWARVRVAYVGEALAREHSTRQSHGVLIAFSVSLLEVERDSERKPEEPSSEAQARVFSTSFGK